MLLRRYSNIRQKNLTKTIDNETIEIEDMSVEELKSYAEKNDIDLGRSTSKNGILKKIQEPDELYPEDEE